ncbi:HIT family protein [Candidatus Tokpelaia sp.]|uniref:HIT family protein n=1 Tax=Candidatus Tokpelaia sp. TaxID=2233777 RepID=UPI001FEF860D|nr:HIT family protein [Candidatus Tokpelaia sp.]
MSDKFTLDKRLAAESVFAAALPLCDVRLMREQRWFWLLLVPRVKGAAEIFDLSAAQRAQSMEEINFAAKGLQRAAPCDKINIGALGNIVRQLHIHIIARIKGDAGWPGPVWGRGARQDLPPAGQAARLTAIQAALAAGVGGDMGPKLSNLLP